MGGRKADLVGLRFGRLLVVSKGPLINNARRWNCLCECGQESLQTTGALTRNSGGRNQSCGCYNQELRLQRNLKHGLASRGSTRPDIYWIWVKMKQRCYNPHDNSFKYYGARGVTVCKRWCASFETFREDMGPRPSPKHSIDRIDTYGNYEPSNCRWATAKEQMANRRPVSRRKIDAALDRLDRMGEGGSDG